MKQNIIYIKLVNHQGFSSLALITLAVVVPILVHGLDRPGPQKINSVSRQFSQRSVTGQTSQVSNQLNYVAGEVLVKFKPSRISLTTKADGYKLSAFNWAKNVQSKSKLIPQNIAILTSRTKSTSLLIRQLQTDPAVEYVEPNFIQYLATTPNDTEYSKLWGMNNTGQTVNLVAGTADADIDAPEAWSVSTGSSAVTVAVIDSGVATGHPDLAANLVAGYDFVDSDSTPEDFNDHGTHVSGAISAIGNNAAGVTGVNWNVKIMPLRVADAAGSINGSNFILALNYAVAQGVKIVNYSAGGTGYSQAQYDAIANARSNGVLLMAAAGNSNNNNDGGTHFYPSDYDLDNIISVAATDQNDARASFSNYGTTSVDVAAPGVNIYSTVPDKAFSEDFESASTPGLFTGTQFTSSGSNKYWATFLGAGDIAKWSIMASGNTINYPYESNSNGVLTSSSVNTSALSSVYLQYDYLVQSETSASCLNDYLSAEVYNGSIWTELTRYCGLQTGTAWINVTSYSNTALQVRFKWVTNSSDNSYYGADVYYVKIIAPTTASYEFMQGTSMATPYVTGLAALLKSYKPTFTYLGLRNTILNNVDAKSLPVVTGGRINANSSITNVDGVAPTATVNYSTTAVTNQNVTATLAPSENIIVTNNSASAFYAFSANGSFQFTFTDLAGNAGTTTATVSNIDKTAPVITIASYNTAATNLDVAVTATSNEGTLNVASHTFTANGSFDFVATDAAGNAITASVTIANIDKTAPVITVAPYTTTPTNQDVIVTATSNEGTLNSASHTFTANGSFDFVATDAAGNVTTSMVTIANIDKSPPIIKTITLSKGAYTYKLNGQAITIRPFGTAYKGAIWARSINFGPDGIILVFLNSQAYKQGQIKVFKVNGKLLKAYNPYGGFATSGLNATVVVESNKKVYLAVGTLTAGTTVKTYQVAAAKLTALTSLVTTTKAGNVLVSFQKLYKTQSGLVTMKSGDKTTIKVWKLDLVKNKFVEDKKINKSKLKI